MNRRKITLIEDFVRQELGEITGHLIAHDFKHLDRVRNWALKIAESERFYELALVEACALLHDVGLAHVERRDQHARVGARIAARFLHEHALFSEQEIEAIADAIHHHSSPSGGGKLGAILRDADKLDALGAVGLMRAFTSKHELAEYDPQTITGVTWQLSMQGFAERFASGAGVGTTIVDQINFQISFFGELETKTAINFGEPMAAFMEAFVRQLEAEITHAQGDS